MGFLAPWISPYSVGGLEEKRLLESPSRPTGWARMDSAAIFSRGYCTARAFRSTVGLGTALSHWSSARFTGSSPGFKGGNWDHSMMRVVDIFYGLPDMLIFILLSLLFGRNIGGLADRTRSGQLGALRAHRPRPGACKPKSFFSWKAPAALGASRSRIVLRHICRTSSGRSSSR